MQGLENMIIREYITYSVRKFGKIPISDNSRSPEKATGSVLWILTISIRVAENGVFRVTGSSGCSVFFLLSPL
jgi:hypothetical protein